ncbi:hypothetical protein KM043_004090 [Ampulex compressa]|nr:hypothetical protein KM043_004090 [Ampulex compressa]
MTLKERAMAPAGETAHVLGRSFVMGGAALGLGALCYYGLGLSSSPGTIDYASVWPEYVRERIKTTYMYVGASLISTVGAAALCLRSPTIMRITTHNGPMMMIGTIAALIGTGMMVHNTPYKEGLGPKQMLWLLHTGVVGAVLAPLYFLGGPLILKAAWCTAGMFAGLSAVAYCAPNEKFLQMGGPLAIGLGVVFASSVGTMFLPPTTALGSGLYSIAMYGGLVLFSLLLLYDTQKIVKDAERHPMQRAYPYDPISHAVFLYTDLINIFIRILGISGGRKKN